MQVLLTSFGFTIFLDVSSLSFSFFTNADDLNKIRETNGGKIKSKMSHWLKILHKYV